MELSPPVPVNYGKEGRYKGRAVNVYMYVALSPKSEFSDCVFGVMVDILAKTSSVFGLSALGILGSLQGRVAL